MWFSETSRRQHRIVRAVAPVVEQLEVRRLMAMHTWIGGADGVWSDPANWKEGIAPAAGEAELQIDLGDISNGSTRATNNDVVGLVINDLRAGPGRHVLRGQGLTLAGRVHGRHDYSSLYVESAVTVDGTLALDHGGRSFSVGFYVLSGRGTITGKQVELSMVVNDFAGDVLVSGGSCFMAGHSGATNIRLEDDAGFRSNRTTSGDLTAIGSTVGVRWSWNGNQRGHSLLVNGDLRMATGSAMELDLSELAFFNGKTCPPLTSVVGDVHLSGGRLQIGNQPSDGLLLAQHPLTIIANDGTDAIRGTFQGLPEGAVWSIGGGIRSKITYCGGDGNDVVLTPIASDSATIISLSGSYNGTVEAYRPLTYQVKSVSGVPQGLVSLYQNGNLIGTSALNAEGRVTFHYPDRAGSTSYWAVYHGSDTHSSSVSNTYPPHRYFGTWTGNYSNPYVSVQASSTNITAGQPVSLAIFTGYLGRGTGFTPRAAAGSVGIYLRDRLVGQVSTGHDGKATFVTDALPAGRYQLQIRSNRAATVVNMNVQPAGQVKQDLQLVANSLHPFIPGGAVDLLAHVRYAGQLPTGTLTFRTGSQTLGTASLGPNVTRLIDQQDWGSSAWGTVAVVWRMAQVQTSVGPITVEYSGDDVYAPATTAVERPDPIAPQLTLRPEADGLVAEVKGWAGDVATGRVYLYRDGYGFNDGLLAVRDLDGGSGTVKFSKLDSFGDRIIVVYGGSERYATTAVSWAADGSMRTLVEQTNVPSMPIPWSPSPDAVAGQPVRFYVASGNGTAFIWLVLGDQVVRAQSPSALISSPASAGQHVAEAVRLRFGADTFTFERSQKTLTVKPARTNLPPVPSTAELRATGDVDGDGTSELIYRDSRSGAVFARKVDHTLQAFQQTDLPAVKGRSWELAAAGDLDRGGDADLVWLNADSGRAYVWFLDQGRVASQGFVRAKATGRSWQLLSAADVDGDGRGDLTWRHSASGKVAMWSMNGLNVRSTSMLSALPPSSDTFAAAGDVTGDGRAELIWRSKQGRYHAFVVDEGGAVSRIAQVDLPGSHVIAGFGRFDGDDEPDLLSQSRIGALWRQSPLLLPAT